MTIPSIPSDPQKRLDLWKSLGSSGERAALLAAAVERNRYEMFATAAQSPACVGGLPGSTIYGKIRRALVKHDLIELLEVIDRIDPQLGFHVRQLHIDRERRELGGLAVGSHAIKLLSRLLDEGLDPTLVEKGSVATLCHRMASNGWWDGLVEVFRRSLATPTFADGKGRTLLHSAARYGQAAVARQLLEKGADVHAKEQQGRDALFFCLMGHTMAQGIERNSRWEAVAHVLVEFGADIDAPIGKTSRSQSLRHLIADKDPGFLADAERVCGWEKVARALEKSTPQTGEVSTVRRI